jgi:hypothetical protein
VFLIALLAIDAAFVAIHIIGWNAGWLGTHPLYSVETDGGYPERFQYGKWTFIGACMALCFWRTRNVIYFALALLYVYFLLDDSMSIHELVGGHIVVWTGLRPAFGLRAQDFGELIVTAAAGFSFLILCTSAYLGNADPDARHFARRMAALIVLLAAFGVGVDMLHIELSRFGSPLVDMLCGVIEDGGEMVMASVIAYVALRQVRNTALLNV